MSGSSSTGSSSSISAACTIPVTGAVDLDAQAAALGIQKGSVYPLDLFHAERHSIKSDFGFDLNFAFQDCGYIVP